MYSLRMRVLAILIINGSLTVHIHSMPIPQRSREQNVKLKEKMRLHLTEVMYIGHVISARGIQPDPSEMSAIHEMPEPKGMADVQR